MKISTSKLKRTHLSVRVQAVDDSHGGSQSGSHIGSHGCIHILALPNCRTPLAASLSRLNHKQCLLNIIIIVNVWFCLFELIKPESRGNERKSNSMKQKANAKVQRVFCERRKRSTGNGWPNWSNKSMAIFRRINIISSRGECRNGENSQGFDWFGWFCCLLTFLGYSQGDAFCIQLC